MQIADDLINQQIGNFTVLERIGQGGMAVVYRARQPSMNRDVALKIIRFDSATPSEHTFRARFEREVAMITSLEHIHILPVYDHGIQGNLAYLAMRLLRGGTLVEQMYSGPIPLSKAVTIFAQVARGLAYAHNKGVIHRDLKPANIIFDDAGNAVLTDFGLAKIVTGSDEHDITQTGNIVGTPTYMSPEQLRGAPLDHRSDIYNMGVILYQMLTGKAPFGGKETDMATVIYRHLQEPPPPLRNHIPTLPHQVEAVVLRALSKDPKDRYNNIGDMVVDLYTAAGMQPSSTDYPVANIPSASTLSQVRSHPLVMAVGAALVMILVTVALLAMVFNRNNNTPAPPPAAVVRSGETGTVQDTVPTEQEIAAAQRRVGANGFIGFIACNRSSEYHAGLAREIVDLAREYGLHVTIYDSETLPARQIPLIEQARSDGAAGLMICPLDSSLLHNTLSSIESAKLPLVLTHSEESNYGGVMLAIDEYLLGLKPGQYAGRLIRDELRGVAKVVILDYPALSSLVQRANGLQDGVLEFAPEAEIIGRYIGGTAELGRQSIETLLADGITFDVIVSINDAGAFGAIDALDSAGYAPNAVIVVGIDAEALAQQYIRAGHFMRGSVTVDRTSQARAMTNSMVKLLGGGSLPAQILIPPGELVTPLTLAETLTP